MSERGSEPFHVVIPARYASQRLPGKPLVDIAGRPMVYWVVARALASGARSVTVATDNEQIADAVRSFGGQEVLTRPDHASGTDRIAEVADRLGWADNEIVVNLQGDEPGMSPALVCQVAQTLSLDTGAGVSTLGCPLESTAAWQDPNVVKVVRDQVGRALYFSRAAIPAVRDEQAAGFRPDARLVLRHLGLYAYRVASLRGFTAWSPDPLEEAEKLEQLRFLGNGIPIVVAEACEQTGRGVDTPADLALVRAEAEHWTDSPQRSL